MENTTPFADAISGDITTNKELTQIDILRKSNHELKLEAGADPKTGAFYNIKQLEQNLEGSLLKVKITEQQPFRYCNTGKKVT